MKNALRGDGFIRSGNWWGNRTTWRMCLDLNRCLYYSDAHGLHLDASKPARTVLTVLDGSVAGEGNGPLAPRNVPLGVVLASTDPVAVDQASIDLMDTAAVFGGSLPEGIHLREGADHILERIWGKDPYLQVTESAKLKLGSKRYTLKKMT